MAEERFAADTGRLDAVVAARLGIPRADVQRAIASPICDTNGECVATISIVLPEQKVLADENHYTEQVRVSAERIEKLMGWRNH